LEPRHIILLKFKEYHLDYYAYSSVNIINKFFNTPINLNLFIPIFL
jgi:hypothetical protein